MASPPPSPPSLGAENAAPSPYSPPSLGAENVASPQPSPSSLGAENAVPSPPSPPSPGAEKAAPSSPSTHRRGGAGAVSSAQSAAVADAGKTASSARSPHLPGGEGARPASPTPHSAVVAPPPLAALRPGAANSAPPRQAVSANTSRGCGCGDVQPLVAADPVARSLLSRAVIALLSAPIIVYRYAISPMLGRNCRFEPSCSAYGLEALRVHGPVRGLWLTVRRVSRCHPWGGMGHDPVPPRRDGG